MDCMFMNGHFPRMPELVYLLKDDNVQNLVHRIITGGEGVHYHKISIKIRKQRFTRGYKRYKETSGLTEWKIGHIFHSIFT